MNDITKQFIDKLVKDNGEDEARIFMQSLIEFNEATVTAAMMQVLTPHDLEAIDAIEDDTKAIEELENRFKLHTGMTPTSFVANIQKAVAEDYLKG